MLPWESPGNPQKEANNKIQKYFFRNEKAERRDMAAPPRKHLAPRRNEFPTRQPRCHVLYREDLGRWFYFPGFRMVCLYRLGYAVSIQQKRGQQLFFQFFAAPP